MRILLTFTGYHDPYGEKDPQKPGPILNLLAALEFDQVRLFSTPAMYSGAEATRTAVENAFPSIAVAIIPTGIGDPTDHAEVFGAIVERLRELHAAHPGAEFTASVTSGTPTIHACWLLAAASSEFRLSLVQIRPQRFVTEDRPLISIVRPDFHRDVPLLDTRTVRGGAVTGGASPLEVARDTGIVGEHPLLLKQIERAAKFARTSMTVLITGEPGTGKELFAEFIRRMSPRAEKPYQAFDCSTMDASLADSRLFGYKKGAFTGADRDAPGLLRTYDGGTLFLDEIGELSLTVQAKLLRAIEHGEVMPIGSVKSVRVDVRIIAATNRDLPGMVAEGLFRKDLLSRIQGGVVALPPLRDIPTDIPAIALSMLDRMNRKEGRKKQLTPQALRRLTTSTWTGHNMRGLRNIISSAWALADGDAIDVDALESTGGPPRPFGSALPTLCEGFNLKEYLDAVHDGLYAQALSDAGGNKSAAARLLGVSPQAVDTYLKKNAKGSILAS